MNKEMKQNVVTAPPSDYASPSVRVIALRTNHTILAGSEYSTNPAEMEDNNVF